MGRVLLLFFILLLNVVSYSQSRFGFELPEGTIKSRLSESGEFYVGIDNPLEIVIPDFDPEVYTITSNNGRVFMDSIDLKVIPIRPGSIRFLVYKNDSGELNYLGHTNIKVHTLPEPKLVIDTTVILETTVLTQSQLLTADSISIYFSKDIPESGQWFTIKEFTFGYNYGSIYRSKNNPGYKITTETKQLIKEMTPNRYISINAIIQSNTSITKVLPVVKIFVY